MSEVSFRPSWLMSLIKFLSFSRHGGRAQWPLPTKGAEGREISAETSLWSVWMAVGAMHHLRQCGRAASGTYIWSIREWAFMDVWENEYAASEGCSQCHPLARRWRHSKSCRASMASLESPREGSWSRESSVRLKSPRRILRGGRFSEVQR